MCFLFHISLLTITCCVFFLWAEGSYPHFNHSQRFKRFPFFGASIIEKGGGSNGIIQLSEKQFKWIDSLERNALRLLQFFLQSFESMRMNTFHWESTEQGLSTRLSLTENLTEKKEEVSTEQKDKKCLISVVLLNTSTATTELNWPKWKSPLQATDDGVSYFFS